MISLVPVLELEPGHYSQSERPFPQGTSFENPAGWHAYWSASLADSGIHNLEPWRPGSWFVPVVRLTEPETLRVILRTHLQDVSDWTDEVGVLLGGYFLCGEDFELQPGCCGDLSNLNDWRRALTNAGDSWEMLWIGHPWSFARRKGARIQLAPPSEAAELDDATEAFSVTPTELREAIAFAERQVHAFSARLRPLLEELHPSIPAAEVVSAIVGIDSPD